MEELDPLPEQGDATGAPVVAGIAVFEGIDTAQLQMPVVVARRAQRANHHSAVEKLQPFFGTRRLRRPDSGFTGLQAVQPEPDTCRHQPENQQFEKFHQTSIRKP